MRGCKSAHCHEQPECRHVEQPERRHVALPGAPKLVQNGKCEPFAVFLPAPSTASTPGSKYCKMSSICWRVIR